MLNCVLRIKVKSIVWLEIYLVSVYGFLRDFLRLPGTFSYLFDVMTFGVFLYSLLQKKPISSRMHKTTVVMVAILFIFSLAGFVLSGESIALFLWGFRNLFRFYFFFWNCVVYFSQSDVSKIGKYIIGMFYLNVITATFELLMGYTGDYIGGTFGTAKGGNAYLNIFIILGLSVAVIEYFQKKRSFLKMVLTIGLCVYLMAIAELKVVVVELPIIVLMAMHMEKFTIRKIIMTILVCIGVLGGIMLMGYFFENSGMQFFVKGSLEKYLGDDGYTGVGDLGRLNAISQITVRFFDGNIKKILLGMGLGSCSYSGYDFLTSKFYNKFSWTHYQWFSDAMVYLEMGSIGLMIYEIFYMLCFAWGKKVAKKTERGSYENIICKTVVIFSVCCMILTVYNNSMMMESGYIAYLILAVPVILEKYKRSSCGVK